MSVIINGSELKSIALGRSASKSTGTLAATTVALFTVTGEVLLTSIYGKVGTTITVANSYKLQHNPTAASVQSGNLCTATDIGTTDTPAGAVLSFAGPTSSIVGQGGSATQPASNTSGVVLQAGQIESVSAGTDGEITWYVTWIPLSDGATLVAA